MSNEYPVIAVSLENDVFQALERVRGTRQRFRSAFVNEAIKEKLRKMGEMKKSIPEELPGAREK